MGIWEDWRRTGVAGPSAEARVVTRYAIFSDIHGNAAALEACFEDLEAQGGADTLIAAGDLCLDGPRPKRVLKMLVARGAHMIRGNTERYLTDESLDDFEPEEADRIVWTRKTLGERWLPFLRDLPGRLRFDGGLLVVHANPISDNEHVWPDADDATLERLFNGCDDTIIAFGHLHLPYVRVWRGRTLVNVASAGLPKDGDSRACYAILTLRDGGWEVKHRRVDFNRKKFARELVQSGMPHVKSILRVFERGRYERLSTGLIP